MTGGGPRDDLGHHLGFFTPSYCFALGFPRLCLPRLKVQTDVIFARNFFKKCEI